MTCLSDESIQAESQNRKRYWKALCKLDKILRSKDEQQYKDTIKKKSTLESILLCETNSWTLAESLRKKRAGT